MPTSSLIEIAGKTGVVDCGLGVTRSLMSAGVDLAKIDLVFLTHLHSDHVLELGPLIHTAWVSGLSRPVSLFGPSGTREYWEGFAQSMKFDIELRISDEGRKDLRKLVNLVEYAEGDVPAEGLGVAALRVPHPPVRECYALRFDSGRLADYLQRGYGIFSSSRGICEEQRHPHSRSDARKGR